MNGITKLSLKGKKKNQAVSMYSFLQFLKLYFWKFKSFKKPGGIPGVHTDWEEQSLKVALQRRT